MTIELTAQQQQALDERGEFPPRVIDPRSNEAYFLIPAEMFERVRGILEDEDDIAAVRETYPVVSRMLDAEESENAAKESA